MLVGVTLRLRVWVMKQFGLAMSEFLIGIRSVNK